MTLNAQTSSSSDVRYNQLYEGNTRRSSRHSLQHTAERREWSRSSPRRPDWSVNHLDRASLFAEGTAFLGYDFRAWNLSSISNHSIQFSLLDPDGFMGFPGAVQTNVTYSLLNGGKYSIEFHSEVLPDANGTRPETPIMLSTHNYWNLEYVPLSF